MSLTIGNQNLVIDTKNVNNILREVHLIFRVRATEQCHQLNTVYSNEKVATSMLNTSTVYLPSIKFADISIKLI